MKFIKNIPVVLTYIGFISLCLAMLWGVAGVVSDALKVPFPGIMDMTEVLMAIAIFFSLIWVQNQKKHIKVTLLSEHYSPRMALFSESLALLLQFVLLMVIAWQTSSQALRSFQTLETGIVTVFPVYLFPGKFAVAIGAFVAALIVLWQLGTNFAGLKKGETGEKAAPASQH